MQTHCWRNRLLPLLYCASLAVTAVGGSLLGVVSAERFFVSGESWIAAGVFWAYSVPAMIALSLGSGAVYRAYRRSASAWSAAVFYLGNLLFVLAGGVAITWCIIELVGRLR